MNQAICFNSNCRKINIYTEFKEIKWKCYCKRCWEFIWFHIKEIWKQKTH